MLQKCRHARLRCQPCGFRLVPDLRLVQQLATLIFKT